eukprot:2630105-Ditylum_brightwellii.AAC.1
MLVLYIVPVWFAPLELHACALYGSALVVVVPVTLGIFWFVVTEALKEVVSYVEARPHERFLLTTSAHGIGHRQYA